MEPVSPARSAIDRCISNISATRFNPVSTLGFMRALQSELLGFESNEAARAIIDFLNVGKDLETGWVFEVGLGGDLDSSPTLRVALLDWLGQVHAIEAARYAEHILQDYDSPDEWALALRNIGRVDEPSMRELLIAKSTALLSHSPWLDKPTGGFLHAFDAAAFSGDPSFVKIFAELQTPGLQHEAVAWAAHVAMEKMVLAKPQESLRVLLENPDLLEEVPGSRGEYFSHLNPADHDSRAVAKEYLGASTSKANELAEFSKRFPSFDCLTEASLLTTPLATTAREMIDADEAARSFADELLADPAYDSIKPFLMAIRQRAESYLASARRGRQQRALSNVAGIPDTGGAGVTP